MDSNEDSSLILSKPYRMRKKIGFLGASVSLVVVYAASAAPIPLYNIYLNKLGLTKADLSLTAVAYFLGTLIALLIFARLSNHLGRRPVVISALGLTAVGCFIFLGIQSASYLMFGRFIQGLACGLASSTITAFVVDNAPDSPRWLGTAVTSGASNLGLAVGAFGSGALIRYHSNFLSLIFEILIILIVCCAFTILMSLETVNKSKGAIKSLVPQICIPRNIRFILPRASAVFAGTWAIGGFYQAFSSSMAAEILGTSDALSAAMVFTAMMAPIAIGGLIAGQLKSKSAQRVGMAAFFLSLCVVLFSLKLRLILPFLLGTLLAGITQGMAFTGSMRELLDKTNQKDRAGVLSAIYVISYSGAAIPNLIVSRISGFFSLFQIAFGYCILVGIVLILMLILNKKAE